MDTDELEPILTAPTSKSLALVEWLPPTIPIFDLGQNPTQTITNIVNNQLKIEIQSKAVTSNSSFNQSINWSTSLFRPVESKRRESKSLCEEDSTVIEELSITRSPHDFSISMLQRKDKSAGVKRLSGHFGFNPSYIHTRKFPQLAGFNSKTSVDLKNLKASMNQHREKSKGAKRLGAGKFSFGSDKKHSKGYAIEQINQNKKLFHYVQNNEFIKVKDLLEQSIYDVNSMDDKQRTCLHIASSRGNLDLVRILLQYGANPNIRDCVSNLPIHLAIISSHVPVVTLLLEAGTDIHSLDLNNKSVLHLAGTRLRWLLNDENSDKTSPKLKCEAIMIMDMIKLYLKRKKASVVDLDILADRLENAISFGEMTGQLDDILNQFDTLNIKTNSQN